MRQDKHFLLDEVVDSIKGFDTFFIIRYAALTANLANQFRRSVMRLGGDVHIMRKRVFAKAAEAQGISLCDVVMDGNIGLVFSSGDPVSMSKMLIQFGKENNNAFEVVGGHVERRVLNAKQMSLLAELPGKAEMQAQFLGTLEAPLSQTLAVFDAIISSVVYCLDNKIAQAESA